MCFWQAVGGRCLARSECPAHLLGSMTHPLGLMVYPVGLMVHL